jgi:hypothetical protein
MSMRISGVEALAKYIRLVYAKAKGFGQLIR